jgi:hypothetical protein
MRKFDLLEKKQKTMNPLVSIFTALAGPVVALTDWYT